MLTLSKTEQDYLKAILALEQKTPDKAININFISSHLSVSAPSATEMIKRLAKKKLVDYTPYHGVNLSPNGQLQARFIIKSHRVWETFLVEKLAYSPDQVHDEAENLEHASSPKLVEYLYSLLGFPETDPHGSLIPSELFWTETSIEITLVHAQLNQNYYLTRLDDEAKNYFKKLNKPVPHFIKIIERLEDDSILFQSIKEDMSIIPLFLQDKIYISQRNGQLTNLENN